MIDQTAVQFREMMQKSFDRIKRESTQQIDSKKPYIVISALSASDLENKVSKAVQQGYCAQGGLSVSEGIYYQAMILVQ